MEDEPEHDPDNPIDDEHLTEEDSASDGEVLRQTPSANGTSMVESYKRPSFSIAGSRATITAGLEASNRMLSKNERQVARREERSLLRDNNIIPPKHPQRRQESDTVSQRLSQHLSVPRLNVSHDKTDQIHQQEGSMDGPADSGDGPGEQGLPKDTLAETTPLLGDPALPYGGQDSPRNLDKKWEQAVLDGRIQTTWQREAKVLARYSGPLVLTFLLQYSLTVASIFTVGHLGKVELGAVSLASMTSNITGYAIYQGLATSLDTLCAQAYGSGRKKLVGLQTQRMVYFLWAITIPIAIIWLCAEQILMKIVPEKDVAILAGRYLKIVLIGAPGYATFESAKRYLQAQGIFSASLYILLVLAPLNALMNWLFVWVRQIVSVAALLQFHALPVDMHHPIHFINDSMFPQ